MIKEAYCSDEVSLLLQAKGFPQTIEGLVKGIFQESKLFVRPTHQSAMAWLREEKHISIIIEFDVTKRGYCPYVYVKDYDCDWVCEWRVNMPMEYEEAVEAALKYCLENLV